MKKLLTMAVITGALMSSAGMAMADTIQGEAFYNGGSWSVVWRDVQPVCNMVSFNEAVIDAVATIDNVEIDLNVSAYFVDRDRSENQVSFRPVQSGALTKITFAGKNSFQCDGHTFLLPSYFAPAPAPAPVPTLSEWAMIMLGALLAGAAALMIRRRRAA